MRAMLMFILLANASCLRKTEFQCADDSACGAAGRCESTGFCSFVDGECASGRRYDESAGTLAGRCTGGDNPSSDGGTTDSSPPDGAPPDTPNGNCPAGYGALAGAPGHLYKVVPGAQQWMTHRDMCAATSPSAYLAIPDTLEELTALDTLANTATYWVGISDRTTEGTWINVLDMPQTFLPWQPPAPDNNAGGQGEDCVVSITAVHKLNDIRCNMNMPAICECNP